MKTKRQLLFIPMFIGIILVLIVSGCKKDDNPVTPQSPLSESQVADIVAASLGGGGSTNGLSAQIEDAADRKSTRLNSSHSRASRMPSSA